MPTALRDGVLSVTAESTAWATQLRMVQAQLIAKIAAAVGDGVVTSLKITGPVPRRGAKAHVISPGEVPATPTGSLPAAHYPHRDPYQQTAESRLNETKCPANVMTHLE